MIAPLPAAPDFAGEVAKARALLSALPGHLNGTASAIEGIVTTLAAQGASVADVLAVAQSHTSALTGIGTAMDDLSAMLALIAPASDVYPVTPSDADLLPPGVKSLFVGIGGDVWVKAIDGAGFVLFGNVGDGWEIPVQAIAVRATGTTAANIVAYL